MTTKRVIWVLSDGKPGHYNQSKGVVEALELLGPNELHWIDIRLRSGLWRPLFKFWQNTHHGQLPAHWLRWAYKGLSSLPSSSPDVIVATGGKQLYALIALAKIYSAKTIFVGTLHGLHPKLLDAILVLEMHPEPQYLTLPLAPMPGNETVFQQAAADWQQAHPLETGTLWAMLIGGHGAGARYQPQDWLQLALWMNATAAKQGIRWLVTTSRRTGIEAESVLKSKLDMSTIADAIWWADQPRKVMSAFLGRAELVCSTIDSLSMITEAISAGRPVIALTPAEFKPDQRYEEAINRMESRGWLKKNSSFSPLQLPLPAASQPADYRQQLAKMLNTRLVAQSSR